MRTIQIMEREPPLIRVEKELLNSLNRSTSRKVNNYLRDEFITKLRELKEFGYRQISVKYLNSLHKMYYDKRMSWNKANAIYDYLKDKIEKGIIKKDNVGLIITLRHIVNYTKPNGEALSEEQIEDKEDSRPVLSWYKDSKVNYVEMLDIDNL